MPLVTLEGDRHRTTPELPTRARQLRHQQQPLGRLRRPHCELEQRERGLPLSLEYGEKLVPFVELTLVRVWARVRVRVRVRARVRLRLGLRMRMRVEVRGEGER